MPAIPTMLGRLGYVAGLRRGEHYSHWGLSRVHGEQAAGDAIAQAHTAIWLDVLRTPLPELFAQMQGVSPEERQDLLRELDERWNDAVPQDLSGGVPAHLSSVLEALAALSRAAQAPVRRAA
ncbi:MAG: hypothetical protein ACR2IF_15460 [Terriglobales bacterium]